MSLRRGDEDAPGAPPRAGAGPGAMRTAEVFDVIALAREADAIFQAQERQTAGKKAKAEAEEQVQAAAEAAKQEMVKKAMSMSSSSVVTDAIHRFVPPMRQNQPGELRYPTMPEVEADWKAKRPWDVSNDLDPKGTYLLEAAILLDAAHRGTCSWIEPMERLNDVLPLVHKDKPGRVHFRSPSGPNQALEIEECGGDGFFMTRLCRARDPSHWSNSDRAQMTEMNNPKYTAYETEIDTDQTIDGVLYDKGPGPRTVVSGSWEPRSKPKAADNVESMTFRSVSRIMFARQPVQMGLQMLQADFSHNNPLGFAKALDALNGMLKEDYPVARGDVQRTLNDYVDKMCVDGQWRGAERDLALQPYERIEWSKGKPAYKFVSRAKLTDAEKKMPENAESHRKDAKEWVDNKGISHPPRSVVPEYVDPEKQETINIHDFASELLTWAHWAMLDESVANKLGANGKPVDEPGKLPRGSCFVRYVDWKDQYYKYPQVPIMRPEACKSLLLWEAYVSRFRDYQLAHGAYRGQTNSTPFDLDEFLNIMYSEPSPAIPPPGKPGYIAPNEKGYESRWQCCLPQDWNRGEWYQPQKDHATMRAGGVEVVDGLPPTGLWSPLLLYAKLKSDPELGGMADSLSGWYPELFGNNETVRYAMGSLSSKSKWRQAYAGRTLSASTELRRLLREDNLSTDQKMALLRFFGRLSNATRTSWRADGAPGPTDYLYVIVVCSGDGASQFGKSMLQAVNGLAEKLGVRRVVLSALPGVVGYYHRFLDYNLVARSGRSLEYLQDAPDDETRGGPYRIPAKYIPLDTSSQKAYEESVEKRKAAEAAFKNKEPESAGLDVYTARKLELRDLHDPKLCAGDKDTVYGITVHNPPEPYYYAHAFFDVSAAANAAFAARAAAKAASLAPPAPAPAPAAAPAAAAGAAPAAPAPSRVRPGSPLSGPGSKPKLQYGGGGGGPTRGGPQR